MKRRGNGQSYTLALQTHSMSSSFNQKYDLVSFFWSYSKHHYYSILCLQTKITHRLTVTEVFNIHRSMLEIDALWWRLWLQVLASTKGKRNRKHTASGEEQFWQNQTLANYQISNSKFIKFNTYSIRWRDILIFLSDISAPHQRGITENKEGLQLK